MDRSHWRWAIVETVLSSFLGPVILNESLIRIQRGRRGSNPQPPDRQANPNLFRNNSFMQKLWDFTRNPSTQSIADKRKQINGFWTIAFRVWTVCPHHLNAISGVATRPAKSVTASADLRVDKLRFRPWSLEFNRYGWKPLIR